MIKIEHREIVFRTCQIVVMVDICPRRWFSVCNEEKVTARCDDGSRAAEDIRARLRMSYL